MKLRLDKLLGDAGLGTRTEVKKYIASGRICVNGEIVKRPEYKADTTEDKITFDNRDVVHEQYEYFLLNKPMGVVSATEDNTCTTVVELIKDRQRKDLFPVGRLDKDTEGLLIITNDGDMAHRLLSPKKHVDKQYFAIVKGRVGEDTAAAFAEGLKVDDDFYALPAVLEICGYEKDEDGMDITKVNITIREGKFHQIKRMFLCTGFEVVYLKRIRMGSLELDSKLAPGEYRKLTKEELEQLLK